MIKKINFPELKNENFVIVPIPFEDELLSSWIVRMAYAHKTHPHTFVNQYLNYRPYAFFLAENDITLNTEMTKDIESKTYQKINVRSLMLTTYSGILQENIYPNNPTMFFSHQKYCPMCLREDKIPYFRKVWRTVFYNICHKHQCYLYEYCPVCHARLDVSKMYDNQLPFTYCYRCGFELQKGRKLRIHKKYISGLGYQKEMFNVIQDGYIQIGEIPVYSFLFFEVFSKISTLILLNKKCQFINKHPLFSLIKDAKQQKENHIIFKRLEIKAQLGLFGLIIYLFDNFPYNLENYIHGNKLTYHDLTTKVQDIPFWYEKIINAIVPRYVPHSSMLTNEEVESAKRYLKSKGMVINKGNLTIVLGCNFYSNDNNLHTYLK